ncbi:threonylcarbamoyl-AMP synthase [Patescibacteria group bacterium]|nr:threonylcarbamoyl-AMP synthase [Patescibacteria group bacterium]
MVARGDIGRAVNILKRGGVIAFPTETTYGLGCDPRNKKAVQRLYKIKGRSTEKKFPLVASSRLQVLKMACMNATEQKLAKKHWPGPLTLILSLGSGREYVAIRVSSYPLVRKLTRALGYPIIATSANRSGEPPCMSGQAVASLFAGKKNAPDLILDGGKLPSSKPSTVARINERGTIEVLRNGAIKL